MRALLRRIDRSVFLGSLALAMVLMVLMACVSFYQVITRFVFEQPSTWSEVTSRSLQIWMVYLGLVAAFRLGALISIGMLVERLRGKPRLVMLAAITGLNLGVLAIMVWYGWDMAYRVRGQMLAGVNNPITGAGISIALVYAAVPMGAALSIVAVLARAAEEFVHIRSEAARGPGREIESNLQTGAV